MDALSQQVSDEENNAQLYFSPSGLPVNPWWTAGLTWRDVTWRVAARRDDPRLFPLRGKKSTYRMGKHVMEALSTLGAWCPPKTAVTFHATCALRLPRHLKEGDFVVSEIWSLESFKCVHSCLSPFFSLPLVMFFSLNYDAASFLPNLDLETDSMNRILPLPLLQPLPSSPAQTETDHWLIVLNLKSKRIYLTSWCDWPVYKYLFDTLVAASLSLLSPL